MTVPTKSVRRLKHRLLWRLFICAHPCSHILPLAPSASVLSFRYLLVLFVMLLSISLNPVSTALHMHGTCHTTSVF